MKHQKNLPSLILFFLLSNIGISQNTSISKAELQSVISSVSEQLKSGYVFPDIGDKMAEQINQNLKSGAYDGLSSPGEISAQLSNDLVAISNDNHIRIKYDPQMNKDLKSTRKNKEPEAEVIAKWINEERKENFGFAKVEILEGNIGLITLNGFSGYMDNAGPVADAAMAYVSNSEAIIFDLRKNNGGSPDMIVHLTSYLLKEATHINSFYYRATDKIKDKWTTKKVKGKKLDQKPIYILTSNRTFSAAEEFTYNLKHLKRATVVGEVTGGGANPGDMVAVDKNFVLFVPSGRAINPITKTNWEGVGVVPHIEISKEKALETAHLEALKKIVATASGKDKKYLELIISNKKALAQNITLSATDLKKYIGNYGGKMQPMIDIQHNQLFVNARGMKMQLQCIGDDLFVTEDNVRIQFTKGDKDSISELTIITPNGNKMNCPKK